MLSGTLLILLGAWGALIAFIGPYFHYAFTPDHAWTYTSGRLWLEVLPGAVALLGGLIVLVAATRPTAVFGAWIAAVSGAWFVVGRPLSTLWTTGATVAAGHPVGGHIARAAEDIGFFTGLGAVILFFAALALGRFTVIGAREAAHAAGKPVTREEPAATGEPVPAGPAPAADTAPATGRRSMAARLPGLSRRQPGDAPADRPAGMTAGAPSASTTQEPTGPGRRSNTP